MQAPERALTLQIIRHPGGNTGGIRSPARETALVRTYAHHAETDTSLTSSLYARTRSWEEGVGEGHFVGARSRSEDREVHRFRA